MIDFIGELFNSFFYRPLFNILIIFYQYIPGQDFGVAVILLTLFIRLLLFPLNNKAIQAQRDIAIIQPELQEIRRKYKTDKEKLAKETIELYKKRKINPFSGILPFLLQLPVLIAIFQVFQRGFSQNQLSSLYPFLQPPEAIKTTFFGIIDLSLPSPTLAFITGIFQFIQSKTVPYFAKQTKSQKDDVVAVFTQQMQKQTIYILPIFTVLILWKLPAVIGLYWLTNTIFSVYQQSLIFSKK